MRRHFSQLKQQHVLEQFGRIHPPGEAEAPILVPAVRESVRQWLLEISAGDELARVKLKPRRTAILAGPPGCGKTTLAHHFAARLNLPLLVVNLSVLVSQWVGGSANNIARLFQAILEQPDDLVVFFDEFDAIASKRIGDGQSAAKEKNAIVISMLQHIDMFEGVLIAATNRADIIDAAIWRRFGMQLEVAEPGDDERFAILKRYTEPLDVAEETLNALTDLTAGASPALLRALMEGIKREMVLAPRIRQDTAIAPVLSRILASVQPPPENDRSPPLWRPGFKLESLADLPWPPELPK